MKAIFLAAVLAAGSLSAATGPIRLHPDNPRWFEWRGKATALASPDFTDAVALRLLPN
jgi:hypothetical protein